MPECNKADLVIEDCASIPSWVTKDYVEQAIQNYYADKTIKVNEFQSGPATAKGDNFASVITRVTVKYECRDRDEQQCSSYLIKSSFEADDYALEKFSHYAVFDREMEIYGKIFPQLKEILKAEGIYEDIVPDVIQIDYKNCAIMFEDLTQRFFMPVKDKQGFNVVSAKMILRKLAKLQAASAILNQTNPQIFSSYDRGMFNRHTEVFAPIYKIGLRSCSELISQWPGYEKYAEKIANLSPVIMEYGKRVFDFKENHINVLVHGDLWITNALFKYTTRREPSDVMIIDFQYSFWGSPTVDLHYFLNTSLTDELARTGQDEFVQYYYEVLRETLRTLKFKGKIPTLKEFWMEYMQTYFYAFISAVLIQPIQINEQTEEADFAALIKDDERSKRFRKTVYSNERVHRILKHVLPIFDRRGLLELHQ